MSVYLQLELSDNLADIHYFYAINISQVFFIIQAEILFPVLFLLDYLDWNDEIKIMHTLVYTGMPIRNYALMSFQKWDGYKHEHIFILIIILNKNYHLWNVLKFKWGTGYSRDTVDGPAVY